MIIVSTRIKGDDRVELVGDDGKEYHFVNAENASYWMGTNTTGLPTLASISPVTAVSGAANTTVTLTGTNFNTSSQVLVNNVPAIRTYVSPTSMTTVLPTSTISGSRLWQISVRNGVYQTAAKPFSFTASDFTPSFTVEADITGTEAVGSTLTCDNGTVIGSPAPTITKQWKRNGSNIPGATGDTYLLALPDQGTVVTCLVTASNTSGSAASIPSTAIIAASGGGSTTTITQDGLVITLNGSLTVTQDVLGFYVVHNASGVFSSVITALPTIDPAKLSENIDGGRLGTATYVGKIMVDPQGLIKQGSDPRTAAGGAGPGMVDNYNAGLAQTLPLSVNASTSPVTVWFYRGLDTIVNGSGYSGCAYWVHVTFCKTSAVPGTAYIRPQIYYVAGGKTFLPTSAINYSALPSTVPLASLTGAVEPDWSNIKFLRRALVQSGQYYVGYQSFIGTVNPAGSQTDYPAYQAEYTGNLLLGVASDSTSRNTLINRVVACGRDIQAQIQFPGNYFQAGGGFGVGYEELRYFTGKFLGDAAYQTVPADQPGGYAADMNFFAEFGHVWKGVPDATWPSGKPLYGIIGQGYPTAGADNHSNRDTITPGVREPWWLLAATGTIQSGTTAGVLKLGAATGYAASTMSAGYGVYCPRGGGETLVIANWDNATKTATMQHNYATAPQVGDVWEYYNGGYYEQLNLQPHVALGTAIVAAGLASDYGAISGMNAGVVAPNHGTVVLAMLKRWVGDQGVFVPTSRVDRYDASQQTTTADINKHCYNNDVSGVWCKKFYTAVAASFPAIAPILTLPTGVKTGSTTATIGATTNAIDGTMYGVCSTSATPPTATQIRAGQNHLGATVPSGTVAVSSAGAKTINVTGLTGATTYYAHTTHRTSATVADSSVATSASFLTDAAGGGVTFVPVTFSGDHLARGGPITGLVDSEEFTYVVRCQIGSAGVSTNRYFVHDSTDSFKLALNTADQLQCYMYNGATQIIGFATSNVFVNADGMVTIFIAGKSTSGSEVLQVYKDSTAMSIIGYVHNPGNMDLTFSDWMFFASSAGTLKLDASVEFVWFDNRYYDISNSTVRSKWLAANINADGSGPGAQPKIFKFGAAALWNASPVVNLGTGGNLAMNGSGVT